MEKGYIIKFTLITSIVLACMIVPIHAEDKDDDGNINNLDLDTEILKNKKEDSSSTSTVGENELFSTDYNNIIEAENSGNSAYYETLNSSVFNVAQNNDKLVNSDNSSVFKEKIKFDKLGEEDNNSSSNYHIITVVVSVMLLISIYMITRRKYIKKAKEGDEDANNYYILK